ncbi:MAG TPA: AraC family transcriptional regulator [Verrucomicrobiae bacterium]|nr:AraC family transcriptional regulator [Verrucomicrobiae bacterium]
MQPFDYSQLLETHDRPWGPQSERLYHQGDGVQYRSEANSDDLLQETVRLNDSAFLLASDFAINTDQTHQQIVTGSDWIHVQFRLNGGGQESIGGAHVVATPEKSCVVSRYPQDALIDREMHDAKRRKYVCLFASPGGLACLMDMPSSKMPAGLEWLIDEDNSEFHSRSVALRSSMALAANDVFNCRFVGNSRRAYMRAKALELVADALDSLERQPEAPQHKIVRLTRADLEHIAEARAIMLDNLESTLTLAVLARRVGLNRTKLAIGFKDLYGVSVQAFWRDAKLAKAIELLRDSDMPVTEVAFSLGYTEHSSFTRAFRKKFGVLPRDCKQQ